MAKSKTPAAAKTAAAPAPAPEVKKDDKPVVFKKEEKVSLAKMRGPRGTKETAKITLLAKTNPKRVGSKAHGVFSLYKDGMTVGAFCDAVDAVELHKGTATPNLVYDAGHGFISIEGYDPGEIVVPKVREPKAPAAPKAAKEPKGKPVAKVKSDAKVDEEAAEEVMD